MRDFLSVYSVNKQLFYELIHMYHSVTRELFVLSMQNQKSSADHNQAAHFPTYCDIYSGIVGSNNARLCNIIDSL